MPETISHLPVLDLYGTPQQMGESHGESRRSEIKEYATVWMEWILNRSAVPLDAEQLWQRWEKQVQFNQDQAPELIEEIKESYIFYLSRHLEAVLEQGMIDRKKSRPSELEPEIAVGGTRGEILSWLPIEILSKFYLFGRSINEQTDNNEGSAELKTKLNELVSEALLEIHMGAYVNRMSDLISRKYLRGLSNDEGA